MENQKSEKVLSCTTMAVIAATVVGSTLFAMLHPEAWHVGVIGALVAAGNYVRLALKAKKSTAFVKVTF